MTHPTDTAKSEELKACPRCGNGAFIAHGNAPSVNGYPVWCKTDRCLKLPPRETEAEGVAAWNRRSSPPQNDAGVEGLREALLEKATWFRCCPSTGEYSGEYCSVRPADDHNMVPMIGVEAVLRILHPMLGQEFEAGWRPIETAPKDGKNVLLLIGETIPDLPDVRVGCYLTMQDARDVGYPDAGWLVWNDCHDYFVTDRATHWMPLPSAPSGEG